MKPIIIKIKKTALLILVLSSIAITGCKDHLDMFPKNAIPREHLTEGDISKLKIGLYSLMERHTGALLLDFDIRGENYQAGAGWSLIDPINMSPSDATLNSVWVSAYTTLSQINFL